MSTPHTRETPGAFFCQLSNPVTLLSQQKAMMVFGGMILAKHFTYLQAIWNVMPTVHYRGL